jgi:glyoxylase-like metal-dependent hydrolase (beta-lactamase superfamily II)
MNPLLRELEFPHQDPPAPGSTLELAPGVHWLRMPLPFALNHINLWLLDDGDGYTIVDCGFGSNETRALWEQIFAERLNGRTVKRVIATHFHPDHMGLAHWLTQRFGVALWTPQGEFLTAHAARSSLGPFGREPLVELFRANGIDNDRLESVRKRSTSYATGVPDLPQNYRRIMHGNLISIGGREWRAIMGYGHAPEHAALYCSELNVLISGDMILPSISTNVGVWPADPMGNPLRLFLDSVTRYSELPADTFVLPSHGLPFRGLRKRAAQLHNHHRDRLAEVAAACEEPRHACDLLPVLFRRELDMHQIFFAMGESIAHLHYLEAEDRLARIVDGDGVIRFAVAH